MRNLSTVCLGNYYRTPFAGWALLEVFRPGGLTPVARHKPPPGRI